MPLVADVHADVVQERAVLQPVAFLVRQAVHAAGLIEDGERELGDLLGVVGPVAAPFGQLDRAAAAHVGIALDLADARAVAMDVVEDEAFAQRQVAQGEFIGAEPPEDRVEEDRVRPPTGPRAAGRGRASPAAPRG